MRKSAPPFFLFWLFFLVRQNLSVLNNGQQYKDITDTPQFGCRWLTAGVLNCTCHEDAEEFHIQQNSIHSFDLTQIRITACPRVRFGQNAITNMRNLRTIDLADIQQLTFEDSSLHWGGYMDNIRDSWEYRATPTLKISIRKSVVEKISSYTFKGRISDIKFEDVVVARAAAFAFSLLQRTEQIEFTNTNFKMIEPQMLKKFNLNNLLIANSYFGSVPSRAFSEINVRERFLIRNSTFVDVKSGAFIVNGPKHFQLVNSKIDTWEGEGFKVRTTGDVLLANNVVKVMNSGALLGLSSGYSSGSYGYPVGQSSAQGQSSNQGRGSDQGSGQGYGSNQGYDSNQGYGSNQGYSSAQVHSLTVDGNTFEQAEANSLQVNTSSFIPKFSNTILQKKCECEGVELFLAQPYLQDLSCVEGDIFIPMKDYKKEYCETRMGSGLTIIISCVVVVIVVLLFVLFVWFFRKVYRSGQYGEKDDKKHQEEQKVIMPDGQTYRETEIMYIVERADLLTTDL